MASTKLPTSPFNGQKFIDSRSIEWTYDSSTRTWRSGASVRDIVPASETQYGLLTPELKALLDGLPKRGGGFGIITKPLLSIVPLRRDVAFKGSVKSAKLNESGSEVVVESAELKSNQFIGKAIFFTSGILKAKAYMLYSNNGDTIYIAGSDGSQAKRGDKFEIIDPLYLNKDGAIVGDIKFTSYSLDISCIDRDGKTIEGYCPVPGDQNDVSGIDIKVSDSFLNEFCISIPGQAGPEGDQGPKGDKGQDGTGDGPIGLPGSDGAAASTTPVALTGVKVYDSNEIYDTAVIGLELDQNAGKLYVLKGKVRTPNNNRPAQQVIATAISRDIKFTDTEYSYEIVAPSTDALSDKDVSLLFYPKHVFSENNELKVEETEVIGAKLSNVVDSMVLHMQEKLQKISDDWDQKIKPFIESKDENARKELYDLANSVAECEWGLGMEFCLGIDNKTDCNLPEAKTTGVGNIPGLPDEFQDGSKTKFPNVDLENPPLTDPGGGGGGGGGVSPPPGGRGGGGGGIPITVPPPTNGGRTPRWPFGYGYGGVDLTTKTFLTTLNDETKQLYGPIEDSQAFDFGFKHGLINIYGFFYGTSREVAELLTLSGRYDPERVGPDGLKGTYWSQYQIYDSLPAEVQGGPIPPSTKMPVLATPISPDFLNQIKTNQSNDGAWYTPEGRVTQILEDATAEGKIEDNLDLPGTQPTDVLYRAVPPSNPQNIQYSGYSESPWNVSNYRKIHDSDGNYDLAGGLLAISVKPSNSAYRSDTSTFSVSFTVEYELNDGTKGIIDWPTPDEASLINGSWDKEIFQSYIKQFSKTCFVNLGEKGGRVAVKLPQLFGKKSEGKLELEVVHITASDKLPPYAPRQVSLGGGTGGGGVDDVEVIVDDIPLQPVITSVDSTDCSIGIVTINGSGFSSTDEAPTVLMNDVQAVVNDFSATFIVATIPSSVLNDINITIKITNSEGGYTVAPNILYCGQPIIDQIINLTSGPVSSTSIRGGSTWRLVGSFGPSASTPTVMIDSVACAVTSSDSDEIVFTIPQLTSALYGYQDLSVTKDGVTTTVAGAIHIHDEAPTVSSISPTSASQAGGTPIAITGTGFATLSSPATPTVTFDGIPASSISSFTSSTIACIAPPHPAGYVTVQIVNNDTGLTVDVPNFLYV